MTPEQLCAEMDKTDAWDAIRVEAEEYRRESLLRYGGTTAAVCAGFLLLPSGDWLDFSEGRYTRGLDHRHVEGSDLLAQRETFTDRDGRTDTMNRWMLRACAIRLHVSDNTHRPGSGGFASFDMTQLHAPIVWGLMDRRGLYAMRHVDAKNADRICAWVDPARISFMRLLKQIQATEVQFLLPGVLYGKRFNEPVVVQMDPWDAGAFLNGESEALPSTWRSQ